MPFIETALFGTGDEENIAHFGAIRLRLTGVGTLRPTFFSLDKVTSFVLLPLTMEVSTSKEPTRLANFKSQRALLRLETTAIDEVMRVNRVIFYVKDIYATYPGQ